MSPRKASEDAALKDKMLMSDTAYAQIGGLQGTLRTPGDVRIIGSVKNINDETKRSEMINSLSSPDASVMNDAQYRTLLMQGTTSVNGKTYTSEMASLHLARSFIRDDVYPKKNAACFNAVVILGIPKKWTTPEEATVTIPATYKNKQEEVLVTPASTRTVKSPKTYGANPEWIPDKLTIGMTGVIEK